MFPDDATTRYVTVDGADVAYQIVGDGDRDLLYCYGFGSHIEVLRMTPGSDEFIRRLGGIARTIVFDRRGTGASDSVPNTAIPTVEEATADMLAVLDAAGSERATILAAIDGGAIAIMFAALHPERVESLVLLNTTARYLVADDYPIGFTPEEVAGLVDFIRTAWGTPAFAAAINDATDDPGFLAESARWSRFAATPRAAAATYDYFLGSLDVRSALGLVHAPTRVLHVEENALIPQSHGRYIAEHLPNGTFVPLPGASLSMTPHVEELIAEVSIAITGERPPVEVERILTTIVFTDIVGSTERAAALGDQRWRALLDAHDDIVREQLRRYRGIEVKTTGDGFLASFDGPARAVRCGEAIVDALAPLGVEVRVGVHTGECELRGEDLGGLAVHIAARIGALAGPGEILVSGTVRDLVVGSGLEFSDRGDHDLKGVPGAWRLLALERTTAPRAAAIR